MKLDIGSAEGAVPADVHLDYSMKYIAYTEEELGFKPVDILADAHYLPFRDECFDEVHSGDTLLAYTGTQAVDEAVRVTKQGAVLDIRTHFPYVTTLIDILIRNTVVTDIKPNFWDGDEIFSVIVTAKKQGYEAWETPPYTRIVEFPYRKVDPQDVR